MTGVAVLRQSAMPVSWVSLDRAFGLTATVEALTLFLALVFGFDNALYKIVTQVALLTVLVRPSLKHNPWIWGAMATAGTCALLQDWFVADNHKYLLVYWLWIVTIAESFSDEASKEKVLTANARFFLVFIFGAAALQKLFSPTYMSGVMFELRLLFDGRFRAFAHLIGIEDSLQDSAAVTMLMLKSPLVALDNNRLNLVSSDLVRHAALAITYYDLGIQILISTLFAMRRRIADLAGHVLLLFFIVTTYIPAPVFGFGWTLVILGFVLSRKKDPRISFAYVAACLAVLAYQTPWREWVLGG